MKHNVAAGNLLTQTLSLSQGARQQNMSNATDAQQPELCQALSDHSSPSKQRRSKSIKALCNVTKCTYSTLHLKAPVWCMWCFWCRKNTAVHQLNTVLSVWFFLASLALCTMVVPTLCLVLVLSFICTPPRVNTFFIFENTIVRFLFFFFFCI